MLCMWYVKPVFNPPVVALNIDTEHLLFLSSLWNSLRNSSAVIVPLLSSSTDLKNASICSTDMAAQIWSNKDGVLL